MRKFEWFIARRYLFSRERKLALSAITLISLTGVALGVAAMIIVQGVMDGADQLIFSKIANLSPHVRIRRADNAPFTPDAALMKRLRSDARVEFAEPLVNRLTLVEVPGSEQTAVVELVAQNQVGPQSLFAIPNRRTNEPIAIEGRQVLLGAPVFMDLRLYPGQAGQDVRLISTQPVATAVGYVPKMMNVGVLGYYSTGFSELDALTAFTSEATMRELYMLPEGYDYIHLKLRDPWQAEALRRELKLGSGYTVSTWAEENSKFFSALSLEKLGMFITMMLVVLVAAFNIIGTLILMAMEKTREIGILRAMGASPALVSRIFMLDGLLIGLVGTAIGLALGLGASALIPLYRLPIEGVVFADHIPVETRPLTVILVVAVSLLICAAAALYPARQAARLNPIEALRFD